MTTYGAYDAGLPCKNISCASHGKPHPNCRCYGDMAAGGEVQHFCATDRAHQSGCEYFQGGGEVTGTDEEPPGMASASADGTDEEPPGTVSHGTDEEPPAGEGAEDTTENKVLTGYQSGLRGLTGPLADMVIKENPLIFGSPDTAKEREEANPEIASATQAATFIGSAVTGVGEAGLAGKAAEGLASLEMLPEVVQGSKILAGAIESGLLQTADEVGQWAMGKGNPEDAVGAATSAGIRILFNTIFGAGAGAFSKAGEMGAKAGLKKLSEEKMAQSAMSFLRGLGFAAKSQDPALREIDAAVAAKAPGLVTKAYKAGVKFFDKTLTPGMTGSIGAMEGYHEEGIPGAIKGGITGLLVGHYGPKATSMLGRKVLSPAALWVVSKGSVRGMAQALDHAATMANQSRIINKSIDGFFKPNAAISYMGLKSYGHDRLKKDLDDFLGEGGMTQSIQNQIYEDNGAGTDQEPPQFAHGGEVKKAEKKADIKPAASIDDGIAMHYPAQNMLLSTARGRVSSYLQTLRPNDHQQRLPFDHKPDGRQQKKAYDKALDVAVAPLSVMDEIQKGTIDADHVKHLTQMYPELTRLLQKRITERITQEQLADKRPGFKVRQGLSLLMGAALSSELTPQSIQAAQAVFQRSGPQAQPQPSQGQPKSHGNTSKLTKVDQSFLTNPQAREKRAQVTR